MYKRYSGTSFDLLSAKKEKILVLKVLYYPFHLNLLHWTAIPEYQNLYLHIFFEPGNQKIFVQFFQFSGTDIDNSVLISIRFVHLWRQQHSR